MVSFCLKASVPSNRENTVIIVSDLNKGDVLFRVHCEVFKCYFGSIFFGKETIFFNCAFLIPLNQTVNIHILLYIAISNTFPIKITQ